MTHIPVNIPMKGFTEQTSFNAVPAGMTPSCLNVLPMDVWNGRSRISTRNGTRLFDLGDVQYMSTFRAYIGGVFTEKLIVVRGGKVYYADPRAATLPASLTLFPNQSAALLNTTGLVEGVQFNEYFYFVDGDHYVKVLLTDTATGASVWGVSATPLGPFRLDNAYASNDHSRATLICRWGARVVLAGFKKTPNVWYACAPDLVESSTALLDGFDAGVAIGAVGAAVSLEYGTLGDPIVAIFPFAQSGLMFGCTNSFSFLTTDPLFNDKVEMVSLTRSIGISGSRAWCQSQEKGAFVLTNDGLYFISPNDFNFDRGKRVSAGRLDSFFLRLDFGTPAIGGTSALSGGTLRSLQTDGGSGSGASAQTLTSGGGLTSEGTAVDVAQDAIAVSLFGNVANGEVFPCLVYDPEREGIWVFLSVSGVEISSLHLYYDLKTDSFWPQRFADPDIYAPTSACYVGTSRTNSGRFFMAGAESISVIDQAFPVGVDGWDSEMEDEDQIAQFVRSSLTIGPITAPLPYRVMLREVRVDMGQDDYELPTGFNDLSQSPILSVSTGETAQAALGLQTDTLFVININPIVVDCGNSADNPTPSPLYEGGNTAVPSPDRVDGRFGERPFGLYSQSDPFAAGSARIYNGPDTWVLRWRQILSTGIFHWVVDRYNYALSIYQAEYVQITPDIGNPSGSMVTQQQTPIDDMPDTALVSAASFPEAEVTEIATLVTGKNTALKCRVRSEAVYLTIASDGKPWAIERASVVVSQVGKSRGDT